MVALINDDQSKFFDVDSDHFSAALTMSSDDNYSSDANELSSLYPNESFLAASAPNESTTLRLSRGNKNFLKTSPSKGISASTNDCDSISELTLPYSLLSEELLKALSKNETLQLKTLRMEAYPESKPIPSISREVWLEFSNHLPNINFVLLTYLTEEEDYDAILASHVPLTHLYFDENCPSSVVARVGTCCPQLKELVVGAYGPDTMDETLISAAKGCPRLTAVGLGDCELTCSGLIEFVSLCCDRLQVLYVTDTSLIEDSEYDIAKVSTKVSSLLGKSWQPNYVPHW